VDKGIYFEETGEVKNMHWEKKKKGTFQKESDDVFSY